MVEIKLPRPDPEGGLSLEKALTARRSVRSFKGTPLDLRTVSQILWAAQGSNRPSGYRTCPSAGALYPLETVLVAGSVEGLASGVYRYDPARHEIRQTLERDIRRELAEAALGQSMIARAPVVIAITAVYERTTRKYGERGRRYVLMESGHAAQNVHLEAVSLNLGTVVAGAFEDDRVKAVLGLERDEHPLILMPVGE